jgi:hypothetical protein
MVLRRVLISAACALGFSALVPIPVPFSDDGAAHAVPEIFLGQETLGHRRVRELQHLERGLREDRTRLPQCAVTGCLTPSEAAALAFNAGVGRPTKGRFILDIKAGTGPKDPDQLHTEDLFYLSSYRSFMDFGSLVLAIEPESLAALIRASGGESEARPSVSRMMKIFKGQRVIVDGEVGLQFIEFRDWESGQRNGRGYFQVWVRVTSPDQITVLGPAASG